MKVYFVIFIVLLILELCYFKIADKFSIIDKPNERSSHSMIVLRGGGIIFPISMIVWLILEIVQGALGVQESWILEYLPFLLGLVLISSISFWDDVHSLSDSLRLVTQFSAMLLMLWGLMSQESKFQNLMWYWQVLIGVVALVIVVGATNIFNFMDGINGITAGYSLSVLVPLLLLNFLLKFIEDGYLIISIIGVLVFSYFNFRPRGKAKCFAGDVGAISIAFIILFALGRLIMKTGDISYFVFLLVYGVDGVLTILHRIILHERLGKAHRKHAYQLMCNELKIGHVKISLLYMGIQLVVSLGFIYGCPDTILMHWIYLICAALVLSFGYVMFMKKYYHLHEEYLKEIGKL